MKKLVVIFIFARSGSKGLKNKNIQKINNKTLLEITIDTAKKLKPHKIYVSSDSDIIKKIALDNDVCFIKRPNKLCTDISPEILSWKHAIKYVQKKYKFDIFLSLPVTSPLRKLVDIKKCIELKKSNDNDLVVCITKSKKSPYFNMFLKKNNKLIKFQNKKYSRRQDTPISYDLTTFAYASTPSYITKTNDIFSGNVEGVEVPYKRSLDIDDIFDLNLARYLYKNNF